MKKVLLLTVSLGLLLTACGGGSATRKNDLSLSKSTDVSMILGGSLGNERAIGTISVAYDYTGGQIKGAIDRGEKEITIDPSKIPANAVPYLIATMLDRNSPSGIYSGVRRIGDIMRVPTEKGITLVVVRLNSAIYYPYPYDLPPYKQVIEVLGEISSSYSLVRRDNSTWGIKEGSIVNFLLSKDFTLAQPLINPRDLERLFNEDKQGL